MEKKDMYWSSRLVDGAVNELCRIQGRTVPSGVEWDKQFGFAVCVAYDIICADPDEPDTAAVYKVAHTLLDGWPSDAS